MPASWMVSPSFTMTSIAQPELPQRMASIATRKRIGLVRVCESNELLDRGKDLSGVEDVLRIERLLHRAHRGDRLTADLGLEVFLLALPDAVLAGASSAHRLRALDQAVHEILAARHLVGVVNVA